MKNSIPFLLLLFSLLSFSPGFSQSTWDELMEPPFPGLERMFSFEIGGIVYVGCGRDEDFFNTRSFWAYDLSTNSWTQKSDFPGDRRRNAFAFQIDGKGYMGGGYNIAIIPLQDFWEYTPSDDSWRRLDNFPGGGWSHSLALSSGAKGYVLAGADLDQIMYNDLWEFDPISETWTSLPSFPGEPRWRAYGWAIDNKIYIGGGSTLNTLGFQDLYAYDLSTGTWEERQACPSYKTVAGLSFSIQNRGYFIEGASKLDSNSSDDEYGINLYAYDPISDSWEADSSFIGPARVLGFTTTIGDQAIVGLGRNYVEGTFPKDVYLFTPGNISSVEELSDTKLKLYPNPVSTILHIEGKRDFSGPITYNVFDILGALKRSVKNDEFSQASLISTLDISSLESGTYHLEITNGKKRIIKRFVKL